MKSKSKERSDADVARVHNFTQRLSGRFLEVACMAGVEMGEAMFDPTMRLDTTCTAFAELLEDGFHCVRRAHSPLAAREWLGRVLQDFSELVAKDGRLRLSVQITMVQKPRKRRKSPPSA